MPANSTYRWSLARTLVLVPQRIVDWILFQNHIHYGVNSMTESSAQMTLCFADFTLQTRPAALRKAGVDVSLQSQPLRLLILLAQRHGEVITHEEIRQHLWGDIHVDFASGIHVCIRHIRRALQDDGETPRFVETVPRKGYRFVASVTHKTGGSARGYLAGTTPIVATIGAIALAVLAIAWLYFAPDADVSTFGDDLAADLSSDDAYLRGKALLASGRKPEAERAQDLLKRAIEKDPEFAPAYASLARAYEISGDYKSAGDYAQKSIATDATYAEGYLRMAAIEAIGNRDWQAAESNLGRALQLIPEQAVVHTALARLYLVTGRLDEARKAFENAVTLNPASPDAYRDYGTFLYFRRDFEAAQQQCNMATTLDANNYDSRLCLYKLALVTKDDALAVQHALELVKLADADPHAILGFDDIAPRQRIEAFEQWRIAGYQQSMQPVAQDPVLFAISYSVLRKFDESFYYLTKARDEYAERLPTALFDPIFIPLWHQSNYLELARDIGVVFDPDSAD